MKFVLKESTPRQNNILLPVYFLTTESGEEHKMIYGAKTQTSYFFRKKTTLTYDEWFKNQTDNKDLPNLLPLHYWFSVSFMNISKSYWDNFFFIYPYSLLAVYFHIKELQRDKITKYKENNPIKTTSTGQQHHRISTTP